MIPLGIGKVLGQKTSGFVDPLAGKLKNRACTIVYRLGLQGKGVRRRRYHKREGWDEEIGVRSGGEGKKFFISDSSSYYLNYLPLYMHSGL